jgi:hypothetical protein
MNPDALVSKTAQAVDEDVLTRLEYIVQEDDLRMAARKTGQLHVAADSHSAKISVAIRYAFAVGRRSIQAMLKTLGDTEGHPFHGNQWTSGGGGSEKIVNSRAARAIATYKPSTRAKQRLALDSVHKVAGIIGGTPTGDNQPMDVVVQTPKGKTIGIEVKTLIDNSNDKITMHPESLARKEQWTRQNKAEGHTLVVDKRGGKTIFYHRKGFGSFRVSNMDVISGQKMRKLIHGEA